MLQWDVRIKWNYFIDNNDLVNWFINVDCLVFDFIILSSYVVSSYLLSQNTNHNFIFFSIFGRVVNNDISTTITNM